MKKVAKAEQKKAPGDPWPTALRILARRDFSRADLRKRLTDKGFDQDRVEKTLQRCQELGYIDDARYALQRATSLMTQGRAVGHRILADLRQHGINDELAEQALAQAREICDEGQLLTRLLERRFPDFIYNSAPAKERRRVVHYLQRRGFSTGRIMDYLTRKGFATDNENR